MSANPLVMVLSAPSGTGKFALLRELAKLGLKFKLPVSVTTRRPRYGELEGREYYFRSPQAFEQMKENGEFVEWAHVHGNLYGTLRAELDRCLDSGEDVALELDVQGMRNLRDTTDLPLATVFLAPPSMEELENRLRKRGADDEETMRVRLQNAHDEMAAQDEYDIAIVNDDLERAAAELHEFIAGRREAMKA